MAAEKKQILVGEGLFHMPSSPQEKPYLIGSKCKNCGFTSFPRKIICPACVSENTMEEVALSRIGKIDTFTVAYVALPGYPSPYLQAYVDLPEGPRILSFITGCEPKADSLKIGMNVEMVIDTLYKDEAGNDVLGFKFKPLA
ncbi:MAG: Zn-ribbon domain-containing OB-fold protein [Candidatus Tectomicrobia bacterium]|uniref:Zn-ribbon domain-containing OB-fold protein n=1 Tax=Tectimicrobiota bacterium TaxID=2528274 RepID=A0A933GLD4_UNCTE|nr:Zn-ribbon domain-containing OB-fold protein [Candidatus Tectomicrobia bacterium]